MKADKRRLEQESNDFKREAENLDKEVRTKEAELHRAEYREESLKAQMQQAIDRVHDAKEEIHIMKQDKEKLFGKLDHLLYENENLRSEIFMMKKIQLEVEKRDLHVTTERSISDARLNDFNTRERKRVLDDDIEQIRNRQEASIK